MESVLVLNANFEPLNVCNMQRAVSLMVMDKAILVINGRGYIKSVNRAFPRPSVIRLQHMISRPRPRVKLTRREVFRRDNYTCQYCGVRSTNLTIDHVNPRHLGGEHTWENVVTACAFCNHKKGGRTLKHSGMALSKRITKPLSNAMYVYQHYLDNNQEWETFLSGW